MLRPLASKRGRQSAAAAEQHFMKTGKKFHLQDIINLEYLFQLDRDSSPVDLHKRDRAFAASLPGKKADGPGAIRSWLFFRLDQEFAGLDQRSPGAIFTDLLRAIAVVTICTGILSGVLAGLAFFSYTGTTPVNVFQFLLLFIAPQLFFIALLLFSVLVTRLLPAISIPTFYALLFERSRRLFTARLSRHWRKNSTARANAATHAIAIIKIHSRRYGKLFYWPFFTLLQGFGLAFNLALLVVSLVKIATSDLAFGWQSTIQLSNAAIHQLVTTLALPWSWFTGTEHMLPTVAEIAGSRIILKDGIYHLTTADLTSWWPFLIMCLLVYGVFTRLLFLCLGWMMGRWAQAAIPFDTPRCRALLRRMNNPLVTTQATEAEKTSPVAGAGPVIAKDLVLSHNSTSSASPIIVFAAIDIYEQFARPQEKLAAELAGLGFSPQQITPFLADYEEDQQLLMQLEQSKKGEDILLLLEGWMVPLVSLLSYIREIRKRVATNTTITVALVGQPAETVFTPVNKKDFLVWQQKIESLADPYIHLVPVTGINA